MCKLILVTSLSQCIYIIYVLIFYLLLLLLQLYSKTHVGSYCNCCYLLNQSGMTPLMAAAQCGHTALVQSLPTPW